MQSRLEECEQPRAVQFVKRDFVNQSVEQDFARTSLKVLATT